MTATMESDDVEASPLVTTSSLPDHQKHDDVCVAGGGGEGAMT
jgi:hypothetical protein